MYSMGLFLGLPQVGTPSLSKQITNNGLLIIDVSSRLESHQPMKDVKILKYIMPRVSVPFVYLKKISWQSNVNYIIFKNYFFQIKKYCEEK
jgi:hypothetical protein